MGKVITGTTYNGTEIPREDTSTAVQKNNIVEMILCHAGNYFSPISRNTIVREENIHIYYTREEVTPTLENVNSSNFVKYFAIGLN